MFHHSKKLCYVVFPKSGSSSMRRYLLEKGFTRPLGPSGHATISDIYSFSKKNKVDIENYTFFSTYTDPIHNFISRYKHVTKLWSGKVCKESPGYIDHLGVSTGGKPSEKIISKVSEMLELWTKENEEKRIKQWFYNDGKLRLDIMLHMDSKSIESFCKKYELKYSPIQHLNKISSNISLTENEIETILYNYELYNEITKKLYF